MTEPQQRMIFGAGDYCVGGLTGALTAITVRSIVSPETDMVLAMLLGSAVGVLVHLIVILLAAPVLGLFHVMVPASLIGMYGGMFFAMRDTMQHRPGSSGKVLVVGIVFGMVMVAAVHAYDWVLRRPPSPTA